MAAARPRWSSLAQLQPAALEREPDEGRDIVGEIRGPKGALEVGDDLLYRAHAVATLEDRAGAAVELHHALGVEQHVSLLHRLPLQPHAVRDRRPRACGQGAHAVTP